jgi:3-deoxy-D-manno-octulosonate 8-phosphate phosphatase (KDO 8-P phosphatase)
LLGLKHIRDEIRNKACKIKLVLTDGDGVLTDTGVYYSERGEEMKRFSIRDGMGVERLRKLVGIETGIITGEESGSVRKRAEKLQIKELHMNIKDKKSVLENILTRLDLKLENIAYIGDDTNDLEVLGLVGLSACPADAVFEIKSIVDIITDNRGGYGAFRDLAEIIIYSICLNNLTMNNNFELQTK